MLLRLNFPQILPIAHNSSLSLLETDFKILVFVQSPMHMWQKKG